MKYFLTLLVLSGKMAWPQVETGSVLYVDFSQDEVTIAADSRMTVPTTGGHDDTECKISAFGDKFVFAMAGAVKFSGDNGWDAHVIARRIWQSEIAENDAAKLVISVSDKWVAEMENIYRKPDVIRQLRKHVSDSGVIANATFAASDKSGNLIARAVNIWFDLPLFDSKGTISVSHEGEYLAVGKSIGAGLDEIIDEFQERSSTRAREYIQWFAPQLSGMSPSQRHAAIASKFIELSILLHPRNAELGFPIDILQLVRTTGVRWVLRKPNCPEK